MTNKGSVTSPPPVSVRAPAKINWFLHVLGKRDDGYHNIVSLVQSVTLYDKLSFEPSDSIEVSCNRNIPLLDNIVYKSALLIKRYTSYKGGSRIRVQKDIPISAGLGGGSSNAASTIIGLNSLWNLGLTHHELNSLGEKIGSDVPFFFNTPCAFVKGRGEDITPLQITSPIVLILIKPPISISTSWAYANLNKVTTQPKLTKKHYDIKLFCQALYNKDFAFLDKMVKNDFEKLVMSRYPVIQKIKENLIDNGAQIAGMTGSGPTVFGAFMSRDLAEKAKVAMEPHWCRVVETII